MDRHTAWCGPQLANSSTELEENLLDTYYEFKGWNREGVPKRQTLVELDLEYVADDLEQRGMLKSDEEVMAPSTSGEGGDT